MMERLPLEVYTAAQVRALDQYAIAAGTPSYALMTRAGAAAFRVLQGRWPQARRILVLCGPGANGGDGYILARVAREVGLEVRVSAIRDPAQLRGDARRAFDDYTAAGGSLTTSGAVDLAREDVIVDALFGTGLSRPVESDAADLIRAVNASARPVLALDIPSGLSADSGLVLGVSIVAAATVTFIGLKLGFYFGAGPDHTGEVYFDGLAAPLDPARTPSAMRIDGDEVARLLPRRARTTHKGAQGRVLIVGGGPGMPGAARMAGEAALRVGAGLVTVAAHPENVAAIVGARPELICKGIDTPEELAPLLVAADVIALGPGLGRDRWAQLLWKSAVASATPLIVDADGLNLLAEPALALRRQDWILTPHPGEAARLLDTSTAEIQIQRLASARALAERFRAIVVLKGACSLVVPPHGAVEICDRGNPGMATAGMGDVLTGVIAGLAAQTRNLEAAARVGVLVHAMAGDRAAVNGERGLVAADLFDELRACVNPQ